MILLNYFEVSLGVCVDQRPLVGLLFYTSWLSGNLFFSFLVISISGLLVGRLHLICYGTGV